MHCAKCATRKPTWACGESVSGWYVAGVWLALAPLQQAVDYLLTEPGGDASPRPRPLGRSLPKALTHGGSTACAVVERKETT